MRRRSSGSRAHPRRVRRPRARLASRAPGLRRGSARRHYGLLPGCRAASPGRAPAATASPGAPPKVQFVDVSRAAGLRPTLRAPASGDRQQPLAKRWLPLERERQRHRLNRHGERSKRQQPDDILFRRDDASRVKGAGPLRDGLDSAGRIAMVIAEGVERKEEYDMVKSLGVHLVQGFFVHKPSATGVTWRPPIHRAPAVTDGVK